MEVYIRGTVSEVASICCSLAYPRYMYRGRQLSLRSGTNKRQPYPAFYPRWVALFLCLLNGIGRRVNTAL